MVGGWGPGWYLSTLIPKYDPDIVLLTSEDDLGRDLLPPGGCLATRMVHANGETTRSLRYRSPEGRFWEVFNLDTLPWLGVASPKSAIARGTLARRLGYLAPDYYGRLVDTEKARTFLKERGEDPSLADATAEATTRNGAPVVRVRRCVVLEGDEAEALAVVTEEVSEMGAIRIVESRVIARARGVSELVDPILWK